MCITHNRGDNSATTADSSATIYCDCKTSSRTFRLSLRQQTYSRLGPIRGFSPSQLRQFVVRHVQKRQFGQIGQVARIDLGDLIVAQVQLLNVPKSPELVLFQGSYLVSMQIQILQPSQRL